MSPRSSLGRPPQDLDGFPIHRVGPDQNLARIHRADRHPAFYSCDGSGRFDLAPPRGTCYLGEGLLASFVEVFREAAVVAEVLVAAKALSVLQVQAELVLADVAHPRGRRFGVTGEIHTSTHYPTTQAWATAFSRAGFDGIRYRVRHDAAQDLIGAAIFGPAGEHDDQLLTVQTSPIPTNLIATAEHRFGVVVLPTP